LYFNFRGICDLDCEYSGQWILIVMDIQGNRWVLI